MVESDLMGSKNLNQQERNLDYWLNELSEAGEYIKLYSMPEEISATNQRSRQHVIISKPYVKRLSDLTGNDKISRFTFIYGILNILIHKCTNANSIIVCTTQFTNKNSTSNDSVLFLKNEILDRDISIKQLLENCRLIIVRAIKHQDFSMTDLLSKNSTRSHNDIRNLQQISLIDGSIQSISEYTDTCRITLEISDLIDGDLQLALNYDSRFDSEFIAFFLKKINYLIELAFSDFDALVCDLKIADEDEISLITSSSINNQSLPEISFLNEFSSAVFNFPDYVAVNCLGKSLSYSELDEKAQRFAEQLKNDFAIERGDVVAVQMQSSLEICIVMLGILKADGVVLPIDPKLSEGRVERILKHSHSKVLVKYVAEEIICNLIVEDHDHKGDVEYDEHKVVEDGAYLIYTSGSTGEPKGVLLTHQGISHRLNWFRKKFNFSKNDVIPQKTSISFVDSIVELLLPLTVGSSVSLRPYDSIVYEPDALIAWMKEIEATIVQFSPSVFEFFQAKVDFETVVTLKILILSGEPLRRKPKGEISSYNVYGCSEGTAYSSVLDLSEDCWDASPVCLPIGRPINETSLYVLDEDLNLLPPFISGDIYIGGKGLSSGYFRDANLTRQKFRPHQFSNGLNDNLYKTGDIGRWLPSGIVEYLGRKDDQIKIRGNRIEIGEVENALIKIHGIDAVVILADKENDCIIAFVVGRTVSEINIRQNLSMTLPQYMIPSRYILLEEIPLTASGKVDRNALRDLMRKSETKSVVDANALTQSGILLLQVWKEVLHLNDILYDQTFFAQGGHSLTATQLILRVNRLFSANFNLQHVFNFPLFQDMLNLILAHNKVSNEIPIAAEKNYFDLSVGQKGLWIASQIGDDKLSYNVISAYQLNGDFKIERLIASYQQMVEEYEILRTCFNEIEGVPKQIILPSLNLESIVDYQIIDQDIDSCRSQINRFVDVEYGFDFDLAVGPLHRLKIVQYNNNKAIVIITMHHIITDAWSSGLFAKELLSRYRDFRNDRPTVSKYKIQYKDYSEWYNSLLDEPSQIAEHKQFWANVLKAPITPLNIRLDFERSASKGTEASVVSFALDVNSLDKLALTNGATMFMVSLASLKLLLKLVTGTNDIIIGCPVSGRNHHQLSNQLGYFLNTIPVRTVVNDKETFADLLKRLKSNLLTAFDHQIYPFENIVADSGLIRRRNRFPLFDIGFTWQEFQDIQDSIEKNLEPGLEITNLNPGNTHVKNDLWIHGWKENDFVKFNFTYNKNLFKRSTIEGYIDSYKKIVSLVSEEPTLGISEIIGNVLMHQSASLDESQVGLRKEASFFESNVNSFDDTEIISGMSFLRKENLLTIKPIMDGLLFEDWLEDNNEQIRYRLGYTGAILFRDFKVETTDSFLNVWQLLKASPDALKEDRLGKMLTPEKMLTACSGNGDYLIGELSCYGDTTKQILIGFVNNNQHYDSVTVVDNRSFYKKISEDARISLREKGLKYVVDMNGLAWTEVYKTENKTQVEELFKTNDISWEWLSEDFLRISWNRPAFSIHPQTEEQMWLGDFHFLDSMFKGDVDCKTRTKNGNLRCQIFYSDFSSIEQYVLSSLKDALEASKIKIICKKGDVLLLDSTLTSHF